MARTVRSYLLSRDGPLLFAALPAGAAPLYIERADGQLFVHALGEAGAPDALARFWIGADGHLAPDGYALAYLNTFGLKQATPEGEPLPDLPFHAFAATPEGDA